MKLTLVGRESGAAVLLWWKPGIQLVLCRQRWRDGPRGWSDHFVGSHDHDFDIAG